jgi:signal transduction histidine kinase/DNA-binding response OmpR family regulator
MRGFLSLSEKRDRKKDVASAWNSLGVIVYHQGRFEQAVDHYKKALLQYQEIGDSLRIALLYNNIGAVLLDQGVFDQAMEQCLNSLAISEALENREYMSLAYHNMGRIQFEEQQYEQALDYYRKSIAFIPDGQLYSLAEGYGGLASVFMQTKQLDSVRIYANRMLELAEQIESAKLIALALYYRGSLYLRQKLEEASEDDFQRVLQLGESSEAILEIILAHYQLGKLFLIKGNFERSAYHLEKGLELSRQADYVDTRLEALTNLLQAYAGMGDFEKALEASKAYIREDSLLHTEARSRQIAEMEAKYQTEQREKELARKELELARQKNIRNKLIIGGGAVLFLLLALFQFFRHRQRLRRREAELALALEKADAERLRELDQLKSNFFANISHEFRTPLTLILGPLQQALDRAASPGGSVDLPAKHLRIMQRNSRRLLQLVNQLLDLARLESGRMKVEAVEGDIFAFLRGIAHSFESLAERKQLHYRVDIPDRPLIGFFDPDKLEKVLVNLLSNAFKFTPEEGQISCSAEQVETEKGQSIRLMVRDSGIGIPREHLPHIFDRFYSQGHPAEVHTGTGLGLALTKELTELLHGTISVESEEGKGTHFTFLFPVSKEVFSEGEITSFVYLEKEREYPIIPQKGEETRAPAIPPLPQPGEKNRPLILIVEDNPDVQAYIAEQLKEEYRIEKAADGQEGLERAQDALPDLIISDVMMPKMDGVELCRRLKTDERSSHIPVILLTAKAEREDRHAGLETGADAYLTKPFDARELKIRVQQLIDQRRKLRERFASETLLKPREVAVTSTDESFLRRVLDTIEKYLDEETFSVVELGREVGMSRSQLHRKLKALTGQSPNQIIRNMRLQRARDLLEKGAGNASEVALMVGFSSLAYFSKCFKDAFGQTPSQLKG